jgi:acyl carrier protein
MQAEGRSLSHEVARITGWPDELVRPGSRLREDLGLDVFDAIELIEEIEDLYRVKLAEELHWPDRVRGALRTVADVGRALEQSSNGSGALDSGPEEPRRQA